MANITDDFFPDYGDFPIDDTAIAVPADTPEPALPRPEAEAQAAEPGPAPTRQNSAPESGPQPTRRLDLDGLIDSMGGLDSSIPDLYGDEPVDPRLLARVMKQIAPEESAIVDVRTQDDSGEEPEARFIRRVAAREAGRSRAKESARRQSAVPDAPEDAFAEAAPAEKAPGLFERLKAPLVRWAATLTARKAQRAQEAATWPAPVIIRETPELSPQKAAHYYSAQLNTLSLRLVLSVILCAALSWIGFGLPMAGMLGQSISLRAAVSLVCLLAVMVASLDIITAGIQQLVRLRMGAEALAAAACLLSLADAVLCAAGLTAPLPLCAAAAISLAAALWGQRLYCLANALNFSTAAAANGSCSLAAERDSEDSPGFLLRRDGPCEGIVRRSEEPDLSRRAYAVAAPLMMTAALVLALLPCFRGDWLGLVHRLSVYLCVCSAFSSFLCFALPYLMAVIRLRKTGAALAGWPACEDIGRGRRLIVSDTDMFPHGTIELTAANIQNGMSAEKVVSYAVSLLKASGSSVTEAFAELMQHRKYQTLKVEDFKCHDGGGLSAYIHNENVRLGSAGFMNLMGIRLPPDLKADNAVCVAISNELAGVFSLRYIPVKGVRQALHLLTQGRTQPVFAIRDFNITPLMIQDLFRIPAINFEFPSFRERYRLSASLGKSTAPTTAILLRSGIRCAVETAERGRRLYSATVWGTALSIIGSVLGLVLIALLSRSGSIMGAGRVLGYMFLWTLPSFVLAWWTYR